MGKPVNSTPNGIEKYPSASAQEIDKKKHQRGGGKQANRKKLTERSARKVLVKTRAAPKS